jgi:hypothetical protein
MDLRRSLPWNEEALRRLPQLKVCTPPRIGERTQWSPVAPTGRVGEATDVAGIPFQLELVAA